MGLRGRPLSLGPPGLAWFPLGSLGAFWVSLGPLWTPLGSPVRLLGPLLLYWGLLGHTGLHLAPREVGALYGLVWGDFY